MANSEFMKSGDKDLLVEPRQPTAAGPLPTLVKCQSVQHEIAMVKELAGEASKDQKVAILARARHLAKRAAQGLRFAELKKDMHIWDDEPGLYVGPYRSAKGLEFDAVFLPFLTEDVVPNYYVLQEYPEDEAHAREARTLYVSVTRARSSLVMSYSGTLTLSPPTKACGSRSQYDMPDCRRGALVAARHAHRALHAGKQSLGHVQGSHGSNRRRPRCQLGLLLCHRPRAGG